MEITGPHCVNGQLNACASVSVITLLKGLSFFVQCNAEILVTDSEDRSLPDKPQFFPLLGS